MASVEGFAGSPKTGWNPHAYWVGRIACMYQVQGGMQPALRVGAGAPIPNGRLHAACTGS